MTQILHIVGKQGSGKTQLAMQIIAGHEKSGKTARLPQDEDAFTLAEVHKVALSRKCRRAPYSQDTTQPDVIILEHQERPAWLAETLQPSDRVITLEVPQ